MSSHAGRQLVPVLAVALAIATLVPTDASAARRRAVRSAPGTPVSGGGCHSWGLIPAGLQASYVSTSGSGTATWTVTYVSDTGTQTKTTQKVTTSQGSADAETTIDQEIVNGLRATKHVLLSTTMKVSGFNITTDVDMKFVPSMEWGPAAQWCTGAKWTVSPVTITTVTKTMGVAQPAIITNTVSQTGEVLSTNETITVQGGTFQTVKYKGVVTTDSGVSPATVWLWKNHPIVIKQESLDAGGGTTVTQLTGVSGASVPPLQEVESEEDPDVPSGTD